MFEPERIHYLNRNSACHRDYVLYWMGASQRTICNHALEYAVYQANLLNKPIVVYFGLTPDFPEANLRHYDFMLKGLAEVGAKLKRRDIKFIIQLTSPEIGATKLAKNACMVITDMGYLAIQRKWRKYTAQKIDCPLIQVESDVIIPVGIVSNKREYAARTIRPKILKHLDRFMKPLISIDPKKDSTSLTFDGLDLTDINNIINKLKIDKAVKPSEYFLPGQMQAQKLLDEFVSDKLINYDTDRNNPSIDGLSDMSPYLHFGQISPLDIAMKVKQHQSESADAYLEELIIRRELSMNFTHFTDNYDKYSCLPGWAKATLQSHKKDKRQYVYTLEQLENAKTHDDCWNAAQKQMRLTGKMHGYMRMYWGKKIIEWTNAPQTAFKFMLYLNNKYELDGRDPNGFCGVAWCFGNHDRPWIPRSIFGTIRYMNEKGLQRKFDTAKYIEKIYTLEKKEHK